MNINVNKFKKGDWIAEGGMKTRLVYVSRKSDICEYEKDGERIRAATSKVAPVELTEDILTRNGFERVGDTFNRDERETAKYTMFIVNGNIYFSNLKKNIQVRYVHELQHLLKNCGSDREVIL